MFSKGNYCVLRQTVMFKRVANDKASNFFFYKNILNFLINCDHTVRFRLSTTTESLVEIKK